MVGWHRRLGTLVAEAGFSFRSPDADIAGIAHSPDELPIVSTNTDREYEQRKASMTALQDWLSISPVAPHSIKAVIREAWRGLVPEESAPAAEKSAPADEPQLMAPGLERC
jgi:hypothetical protein